jgi:DNA repair exonuclease SbcCD nuclease subunit
MTFEAVGVGDLHLTDESGKGGLANYIEAPNDYVMSEVDRVCNYARKKNIGTAILYGDICENPRMSYEAQIAFRNGIKRNKDIEFIVYPGNHDSKNHDRSEGHSLELIQLMGLKNLRIVLNDEYIQFGKQKIKICPWPSTAFDKTCLNFAHIEVYGAQLDSGRKIENDDLKKTKAVVAMGHLHTNHRVRNVYYSGTLYQTNFGESLPKFFHHIVYDSPEDYEIINVPFAPKYRLHNCVVETAEDVKALPTDPHDLIKLVVQDGADVDIPNRPNIVINKTFKTKMDLATILTEDLMNGQELVLNSAEFFASWIAQQSVPQRLKKQTAELRERLLTKGVK